jgi:hypothetical protein
VALIYAELEVAGAVLYRWLSLPIAIRSTLPVDAPSGTQVTVSIGPKTFDPVTSVRSKATVTVEIPPGIQSMQITLSKDGAVPMTQTRVLKLPAFARLALALPRRGEAGERLTLEAFVVDASGRPFVVDIPRLSCNVGEARLIRIEGARSVQRFLVQLGGQVGEVPVRVAMREEVGIELASSLKVEVAKRYLLEISAAPRSVLIGSAQAVVLLLAVNDQFDNPAEPDRLEVTANGAAVAMSKLSEGRWRGFLYAPKARPPCRCVCCSRE